MGTYTAFMLAKFAFFVLLAFVVGIMGGHQD